MPPIRRYWSEMSTTDFTGLDTARTVAVLPVSAVEQHGPHLPLSVDVCINEGVLDAALALLPEDAPVLVLPPQTVGKSEEHIRFPGTLTVPADVLVRHWNEIGDGVARTGVRKILFFNSHGGNPPVMDIVSRDLRIRHGMLAAMANWYDLVPLSKWFGAPNHLDSGTKSYQFAIAASMPCRIRRSRETISMTGGLPP